jgi:hypothetical protein
LWDWFSSMSHTKMQFLLLREQTVSIIKTNQLMLLFTAQVIQNTNTARGKEFCNVTAGGMYSYH